MPSTPRHFFAPRTKPRTLLAALLLEHGQVIPVRRLVDVIWSDTPPDTATALIQTYISALRRAVVRPGGAVQIDTHPPGYVIRAEPDSIDRVVFERLTADGRRASAGGRFELAAQRLGTALALWHGPALGGIGGTMLAGEAARLEEMRLVSCA
jgi:DNA-binding SARP family transcriptional activator